MIITDALLNFSEFLDRNWLFVKTTLKQSKSRDTFLEQDMIENWMQFSWEVLVEAVVCGQGKFLDTYGSGADCHFNYPLSERVMYPEKEPDYFIKCVPISSTGIVKDYIASEGNLVDITLDDKDFYKLVSVSTGCYEDSPPFNYVLLEDLNGVFYAVSKYDVDFLLVPINRACK